MNQFYMKILQLLSQVLIILFKSLKTKKIISIFIILYINFKESHFKCCKMPKTFHFNIIS